MYNCISGFAGSYINRIKVEFKCGDGDLAVWLTTILIESKWNLNSDAYVFFFFVESILIESKWNLNQLQAVVTMMVVIILIESKWNLNQCNYRYLLTFLAYINRIKVEFKLSQAVTWISTACILIESKWNLN